MRENREKWIELSAHAATEQDSRKLMALIDRITALLDAKERLIEKDSQGLKLRTNWLASFVRTNNMAFCTGFLTQKS